VRCRSINDALYQCPPTIHLFLHPQPIPEALLVAPFRFSDRSFRIWRTRGRRTCCRPRVVYSTEVLAWSRSQALAAAPAGTPVARPVLSGDCLWNRFDSVAPRVQVCRIMHIRVAIHSRLCIAAIYMAASGDGRPAGWNVANPDSVYRQLLSWRMYVCTQL